MMKLVVGLGNPGREYENSRHNVGYMVVEELVEDRGLRFVEKKRFKAKIARGGGLMLVKPLRFMNKSGGVVSRVVNFYRVKLDDLYVVFDDLDLKLGEFKIQKGKGPKDHKGLLSIEKQLGEEEFWRVRMGVDNRQDREIEGKKYVLSEFGKEERRILDKVIEGVVSKLEKKL